MTRLLPLALLLGCPVPKDDTGGDTADTDTDTDSDTDSDTDTDTDTDTDVELLPAGFESMLDTSGGCSDTWIQAWTSSGRYGLEVYEEGILAEAISTGAAVDRTLTIGVDPVTVFVEIADPVAINYCTDVIDDRTVYNRYDATAGVVTLHMEPPASEYAPGILDVALSDVDLASGGDSVTISSFTVTGIDVVQNWGG